MTAFLNTTSRAWKTSDQPNGCSKDFFRMVQLLIVSFPSSSFEFWSGNWTYGDSNHVLTLFAGWP
jgi:hypothetical protein